MNPQTGTAPATTGASTEAKLTRFLIFEPLPDEVCVQIGVPPGTGWKIVGYRDASDRDQAEGRFYTGVRQEVQCCPVSENAWKPRTHIPKIVQPARREPIPIDFAALPTTLLPATGDAVPPSDATGGSILPPAAGAAENGSGGLEVEGLAVDGADVDALADDELAADA